MYVFDGARVCPQSRESTHRHARDDDDDGRMIRRKRIDGIFMRPEGAVTSVRRCLYALVAGRRDDEWAVHSLGFHSFLFCCFNGRQARNVCRLLTTCHSRLSYPVEGVRHRGGNFYYVRRPAVEAKLPAGHLCCCGEWPAWKKRWMAVYRGAFNSATTFFFSFGTVSYLSSPPSSFDAPAWSTPLERSVITSKATRSQRV